MVDSNNNKLKMYISDSDSDNDNDIEQYDDIEQLNMDNTDVVSESSSSRGDDFGSLGSGNEHQNYNAYANQSPNVDSDISDDDADDDDDDELENTLDIFLEDAAHLYMEKQDQQYYIGFCKPIRRPNLILMVNSVSPNTFFHHSFERIYQYLQNYSTMIIRSPKMEIMQLHITNDEVYSIVIKTHWLRLVQRHWKRLFKTRAEILRIRMTPQALRIMEITGKFPFGLRTLPDLRGMMNVYASVWSEPEP